MKRTPFTVALLILMIVTNVLCFLLVVAGSVWRTLVLGENSLLRRLRKASFEAPRN